MNETKEKSFDCVRSMRQIRDRLSEELAGMSYDEIETWLRSHRYSDPLLQRLADKAKAANRSDAAHPGSEQKLRRSVAAIRLRPEGP
jgi:hypothetical protein